MLSVKDSLTLSRIEKVFNLLIGSDSSTEEYQPRRSLPRLGSIQLSSAEQDQGVCRALQLFVAHGTGLPRELRALVLRTLPWLGHGNHPDSGSIDMLLLTSSYLCV